MDVPIDLGGRKHRPTCRERGPCFNFAPENPNSLCSFSFSFCFLYAWICLHCMHFYTSVSATQDVRWVMSFYIKEPPLIRFVNLTCLSVALKIQQESQLNFHFLFPTFPWMCIINPYRRRHHCHHRRHHHPPPPPYHVVVVVVVVVGVGVVVVVAE